MGFDAVAGGVPNLAPFLFFPVVSRPPMVSLTIRPRSDRQHLKDILVNIRETKDPRAAKISRSPTALGHRRAGSVDHAHPEQEAVVHLVPARCLRRQVPPPKSINPLAEGGGSIHRG